MTMLDSRLRGEAPLALDKRAREKRPSHWEKVLGGNDGVAHGNGGFPTGQSMKVTMYGCFEKRVAQVTAKA